MPIYDFHCPACNKTCELLVRYEDTPNCPLCGGENLERKISGTSPPGTAKAKMKAGRAAAARQGHFSNFSR